jgi:hypothetical protein
VIPLIRSLRRELTSATGADPLRLEKLPEEVVLGAAFDLATL